MTLIAAADGSALGNPGAAGWAWFINEQQWRAGGWKHATNNQAELMAVLSLLTETANSSEPLHILCDSQYVINSLTKWMPGWKRKGWRKSDGKPVLNRDLLEQLDDALQGRNVTFEWVKGHAGHVLNERVDDLARDVATAFQSGTTPNEGPGFDSVTPAPAVVPVPTSAPSEVAPPSLFDHFEDEAVHTPTASDLAIEHVLAAERSLLTPEVRSDASLLTQLFHREVYEVTAAGRVYASRDSLVELLLSTPNIQAGFELITTRVLSPTLIQVVFRTTGTTPVLRTSLWEFEGTSWQLRFHQATTEA